MSSNKSTEKYKFVKSILISPDIALSVLVGFIVYILSPDLISNPFCKDIFSVGISILSIVFSVYFAALAFIISASDNDFIKFMEEKKQYTSIIGIFRVTLIILFLALLISIIAYVATLIMIETNYKYQYKWIISFFTFSFFYGLLAAFATTLDSIRFALSRANFIRKIMEIEKDINDTK